MTYDYKRLCNELLSHLYQCDWPDGERFYALVERARAALAEPKPERPTQSIPVSERLPGPEDCDAEGRCWWYGEGEDMVGWTYQDSEGLSYYKSTHWLPANALLQPLSPINL